MNTTSRFVFKGYSLNQEKAQIDFQYDVEHRGEKFYFTDTLIFPSPFSGISESILKPFLDNLLLILGTSYWKIFCPKAIEIAPFSLTKDQADFWNTVYTKGLGEFFYKNKIDFRGLVEFPYEETKKEILNQVQDDGRNIQQNKSLVPIGGGKDGIVVAELLKKAAKEFTTVLIYTGIEKSNAQEAVASDIGHKVLRIHHLLDPQLKDLNKREDTYNGHVPTVAMHAFMNLFAAAVYGYNYIVLANEESANYGNVEYLGATMNHQWSKSLEFETLFQEYTKRYLSTDITYFSLLRPLSEIKIAQLFSEYPQYFSHFVSCNKGYTMAKEGQTQWCGKCPKCAFVFLLLAAYLPKEKVVGIFGKNLFADTSLLPLYKELLGLQDFKPFECVGTPEETMLAFYYAHKKGEWNDTAIMKFFIEDVLPTIKDKESLEKRLFSLAENRVPEEFKKVLSQV